MSTAVPPAAPPVPAAAAPAAAAPVVPVPPARRRLSRTTLVVAGIILLAVLFCILSIKVAQKIALMNATVLPEAPLSTPEVLGGPLEVVPEVILPLEQPPANVPAAGSPDSLSGFLFGSYDIVVAGSEDHPGGSMTYSEDGSFNANLEMFKVRIEGDKVYLTLRIDVSQVSRDPLLFQIMAGEDFPGARIIINEELVMKATGTTLPFAITEPGLIVGDLIFNGQIPITEPGEYKITLQISGRGFQQLEGWLESSK